MVQDILQKEQNREKAVAEAKSKPTPDNLDNLILAGTSSVNILTSTSTDPASLHRYGVTLAQDLAFLSAPRNNEITLTLSAIDNNDQSKIKEVVASRIKFENAEGELSQTIVPIGLATEHRAMLTNIKNMVTLLKQMELALGAPQSATEASRLFLQEEINLFQNIDQINSCLDSHQANLTAQEKLKVLSNFSSNDNQTSQ